MAGRPASRVRLLGPQLRCPGSGPVVARRWPRWRRQLPALPLGSLLGLRGPGLAAARRLAAARHWRPSCSLPLGLALGLARCWLGLAGHARSLRAQLLGLLCRWLGLGYAVAPSSLQLVRRPGPRRRRQGPVPEGGPCWSSLPGRRRMLRLGLPPWPDAQVRQPVRISPSIGVWARLCSRVPCQHPDHRLGAGCRRLSLTPPGGPFLLHCS